MATTITYPVDDAELIFDSIVFDANTNDRVTFAVNITENPVEGGSVNTDNVQEKPFTVSVDALITDYPLSGAGGGIATTSPQTPNQLVFGSSSAVRAKPGRALEIIETLQTIQARGARVSLELGERFFTGLVIQTVTVPRDRPLNGAYRIQIAFLSIITAESETVVLKQVSKAKPVKNSGKQTTTPAPDAVRRKSSLASFTDTVGELVIPAGVKKWVQP
jgi:hypothetical protein